LPHKSFKTLEAAKGFEKDYYMMLKLFKIKPVPDPADIVLFVALMKLEDKPSSGKKKRSARNRSG
jgi:hypothetical protein